MKKFFWILIFVMVIGVLILISGRRKHDEAGDYRSVESDIKLNEAQLKELPPAEGGMVTVLSHLDTHQTWQVTLGERRPNSKPVGQLHRTSFGDTDAAPVYLCSYPKLSRSPTTSLDLDPRCSGEGENLNRVPVGYVSARIRTGYRLMVRCLNREKGMYLSLNPRCESPSDQMHGTVGAIRATNLD